VAISRQSDSGRDIHEIAIDAESLNLPPVQPFLRRESMNFRAFSDLQREERRKQIRVAEGGAIMDEQLESDAKSDAPPGYRSTETIGLV
jgi:hypothetical protein